MKNRGVSCGKYRLCGFLNLQPFFPAFVYPVFRQSDSKHNIHYFFEDGKKSKIQKFYEIDFKTFPELIKPLNLGHHNYIVGSETLYAFALSSKYVVWGNIVDFIPLLKSVLPMLQSHGQQQSVKSFISSHWIEYSIKCMKRPIKYIVASEQGWYALLAVACVTSLLLLAYSPLVFYDKNQTSVPIPSWSGFITPIPGENNPSVNPPSDDDNSTVHYQRLNATSSSVIIHYLTNTFVTGNPDIGDSDYNNLASDDILAVDSQSGKMYDIQDLGNTLLLIPYQDGTQTTIFYGSLSAEGNWDGRCVTNVYEDQKLKFVIDSYYDNGNLLSYKQMYTYITAQEEQVWAFSSRVVQKDNYRSGETWTFYYADIPQKFSYDSVAEGDIIFADQFDSIIESIGARIEGYYNGNTLNGTFNDNTGHAYMVKYFKEDGTVRTLYVGCVENGSFSDQTGSAWLIGKNNIDQEYYTYFIGTFSDGKCKAGRWTSNLTQEKIDEFLDGYTFNCMLPGLWADEQKI